jgi:hypothetical protein
MDLEKEKIIKAGEILNKMANGVNPVNGAPIDTDCFLQDPRIIRCLFFVQQVLNKVVEGSINNGSRKAAQFIITAAEKSKVRFLEGNIGINQFARCINSVIDLNRSRKITGVEINKQLKKMGILAEELLADGKKRTIVNESSYKYGIETEKRNYNGVEYDMVCFNDIGKKFLLDDLEKILEWNADND